MLGTMWVHIFFPEGQKKKSSILHIKFQIEKQCLYHSSCFMMEFEKSEKNHKNENGLSQRSWSLHLAKGFLK